MTCGCVQEWGAYQLGSLPLQSMVAEVHILKEGLKEVKTCGAHTHTHTHTNTYTHTHTHTHTHSQSLQIRPRIPGDAVIPLNLKVSACLSTTREQMFTCLIL